MNSKSIFDAYSDFQASNVKINKSTLRSVIHRFLAEDWGGQAPKGSKANNQEVFKFIELMKTLPSTFLVNSMDVLEQKFIEKRISKDNSKSYKSAYKAFIDWAESNNYFLAPIKETEPTVEINLFKHNKKGSGGRKRVSHNRKYKDAYTLMARQSGAGQNSGNLIYPTDYVNEDLLNDLRLFEKFRKEDHACAISTVKTDMKLIYQILGWLHRYKNIPLENLRLTSIISFIKLNINRSSFKDDTGKFNYQEYVMHKAIIRQDAVDLANEDKDLIKEYLDFVGGHPKSKVLIVTVCIGVAKFIFRNEIGTDDYIDDTDLAIIRKLNQLRNTLSKLVTNTPDTIPHSAKSISWTQTINILQTLRLKADFLINKRKSTWVDNSGKTHTYLCDQERDKSAISNDLQRFLSLAFMILIPTDRSRTYYELEVGKTFVYGLFQDNKFTSIDKLQNKAQAIWYIHLMPDSYKTGRTYKEYWGIMPNVEFEDGKKLYEYIDKWINKARECENKCSHNRFFRGFINYKVLNSSDWGSRIKTIFESQTGVPVTPKEIRKMYITHLNNLGATNAELKGAAYAQHHSQKMQESVYNSQTGFDRVAPVYELNARQWKKATEPPSKKELNLV